MPILSLDLKQRIIDCVLNQGLSQAATARRLMVSDSTVSRIILDYKERGTLEPRQGRRGPKPLLKEEHLEWIRLRMKDSPFLSDVPLDQ